MQINYSRNTIQGEAELNALKEQSHKLRTLQRIQCVIQKRVFHHRYQHDLHLTNREIEVLCLVAEGRTDREVAKVLLISHRTVNRHLSNIFVKLDVPGRTAAVAYGIRCGFVD